LVLTLAPLQVEIPGSSVGSVQFPVPDGQLADLFRGQDGVGQITFNPISAPTFGGPAEAFPQLQRQVQAATKAMLQQQARETAKEIFDCERCIKAARLRSGGAQFRKVGPFRTRIRKPN
jgi:hypothetical protein